MTATMARCIVIAEEDRAARSVVNGPAVAVRVRGRAIPDEALNRVFDRLSTRREATGLAR